MSAGADVNGTDERGWTPLLAASSSAFREGIELLLSAGADPNSRDDQGCTPLHEAAENGDADIVHLLLAAGARPHPPVIPHRCRERPGRSRGLGTGTQPLPQARSGPRRAQLAPCRTSPGTSPPAARPLLQGDPRHAHTFRRVQNDQLGLHRALLCQ
ncbi:ankyrin repeat domain-containing protein [Streptomyces oryzae]|uniref:Ankyrin repeat domain-containing protein n=1 Tax=Streptomyces oryzae TaxID=1434886 RepID=A0ABS3X9F6_9ACTN|nr:ankyrin repeat domain-containing protein [Streptomyces oryzae]